MIFTALPVNVGDSFLLRKENLTILVDGGQNKSHIVKLLTSKIANNHIDILICTHYDADHYNGILGIINSNKFTINQIWMPDILGHISYIIKKDIRFGLSALQEISDFQNTDLTEEYDVQENDFAHNDNEDDFEQTMLSSEHLHPFFEDDIYYDYRRKRFAKRQLRNSYDRLNSVQKKMLQNFFDVPAIVNSLFHCGARLRWFKYQITETPFPITSVPNVKGTNCKEVRLSTLRSPNILLKYLYLTAINKHSLNFLYDEEFFPNILFTADSDISYRTGLLRLKENSIVTAPHHGADSASRAYAKISGSDLIFVRSDRSQVKRPCPQYLLASSYRYCTICRNYTIKSEVELTFNRTTGKFVTTCAACSC